MVCLSLLLTCCVTVVSVARTNRLDVRIYNRQLLENCAWPSERMHIGKTKGRGMKAKNEMKLRKNIVKPGKGNYMASVNKNARRV